MSVDGEGNIISTRKQVGNADVGDASINAGEKLIEDTVTAATLNVNEYLRLMVAGKADASDVDARGQRVSAAELKITDSAIVSTVTSGTAYQQAQHQIYTDMDTLLDYRLEIKAGTVFLTENVRSTALTAHVWHGNTEVTDTIEATRFRWFRESDDAIADEFGMRRIMD